MFGRRGEAPVDECQRCGRGLGVGEPMVTVNWHLERIGRRGSVSVLDAESLVVLCESCGAHSRPAVEAAVRSVVERGR